MNGRHPLVDRFQQCGSLLSKLTTRLRRREMVLALLVLVIPVLAIAQPLGLLLWARMRILTSIPRTAMAVEGEQVVVVVPEFEDSFPDLPVTTFEARPIRDPLSISSLHFPRSSNSTPDTGFEPKSPSSAAEEDGAASRLRDQLAAVAARLEVQGLMPGQGLALVNGRVRRVGEEFPGNVAQATFHLIEVRKSAIVVRIEGLEFDIRLNGGGTGSVDIRP